MKLKLEINNIVKVPMKKALIKSVVFKTLEESGYDYFLKDKEISLSIAWVCEEEIQRLNETYRKKNRVTDVLSFCEYEDAEILKKTIARELFLGELILCYNYIQESTKECASEKDLQREVARIIAHGVLHLLCFSHGKKMFNIQDAVAKSVIA